MSARLSEELLPMHEVWIIVCNSCSRTSMPCGYGADKSTAAAEYGRRCLLPTKRRPIGWTVALGDGFAGVSTDPDEEDLCPLCDAWRQLELAQALNGRLCDKRS